MAITAWINSEKTKVFIINNLKSLKYCGKITAKQYEKLQSITSNIIYHVGDTYFSWYKTFPENENKWTNNINNVLIK